MTRPPAPAPLAVTVVICSRDRRQMLRETVQSTVSATPAPAEVLIVDQSPAADSQLAALETGAGCRITYLHTPLCRGLSRARNLGMRSAAYDVVVLIDDDMLVGDGALERLISGLGDGDWASIATGRVLAAEPEGPGLAQAPSALISEDVPAIYRGRQDRLVIPGANIGFNRTFVLAAGGYDERLGPGTRFPAGEDHDLARRLLDAGCVVRHVPEAIVLHRSWRSSRDLLRQRWNYAHGVGGYYAKHLMRRDRHAARMLARLVLIRVRGVGRSVRRNPRRAAEHAISLIGTLIGVLAWMLRERRLVDRGGEAACVE